MVWLIMHLLGISNSRHGNVGHFLSIVRSVNRTLQKLYSDPYCDTLNDRAHDEQSLWPFKQ